MKPAPIFIAVLSLFSSSMTFAATKSCVYAYAEEAQFAVNFGSAIEMVAQGKRDTTMSFLSGDKTAIEKAQQTATALEGRQSMLDEAKKRIIDAIETTCLIPTALTSISGQSTDCKAGHQFTWSKLEDIGKQVSQANKVILDINAKIEAERAKKSPNWNDLTQMRAEERKARDAVYALQSKLSGDLLSLAQTFLRECVLRNINVEIDFPDVSK